VGIVPELTEQTLILLAVAAAALVLIGVLVLIDRSARRRMEKLLPAFEAGTAATKGFVQPSVTGLVSGYAFHYRIEPASQYSPGGAVSTAAVASTSRWSVRVADLGSTALVKLGILADHSIGDDELDKKLRFGAPEGGILLAAFGTSAARNALRVLADGGGFHGVALKPDRCTAQWRPRSKGIDEDPTVVRDRLEAVAHLLAATGCPPRLG